MGDNERTLPAWFTQLSLREQDQIKHAREYTQNYAAAGVPGHGQFLLIAKLADLIDGRTLREETPNLLTPADPPRSDTTRPPDTSKRPKGFV